MNNNEFIAYRAEDSMSIVTMALYDLPIPVIPMAARTFLLCRTSRMTIMRVRKMLSVVEIKKYGSPKSTVKLAQMLLFGREVW